MAVQNARLVVRAGEVVAIVGQTGSGKTTLGKMIVGLVEPDAGQVFFEGQDLFNLSRDQLAQASGIYARDIIDEVNVRAAALETLAKKEMNTMKEVTVFCRAYNNNPQETLTGLGLDRAKIIRSSR